jgi:hypothetical protein
MSKAWNTIIYTPIAGGYVSSAIATALLVRDSPPLVKPDMWETTVKYGAGITDNFAIIKARVPTNPVRPGDEFGFEYDTAVGQSRMFDADAHICRFGKIEKGSIIGIKGNITPATCVRRSTVRPSSHKYQRWSTASNRYWLLNDYGIFVPQEGISEEEYQFLKQQERGERPMAPLNKISDLKVEIAP